jgi:hypothetical protein
MTRGATSQEQGKAKRHACFIETRKTKYQDEPNNLRWRGLVQGFPYTGQCECENIALGSHAGDGCMETA